MTNYERSSAHVWRRFLARLVLALATAAVGVGVLVGFESISGRRPAGREFLYEPHRTPVAVSAKPPSRFRPTPTTPPPPVGVTVNFVVQVSAKGLGAALLAEDFHVTGGSNTDRFEVTRAEYVPQITAQSIRGGASTVALVFDQSGSIIGSDPQNLRIDAGVQFVDKISPATRLAVFTFGEAGETSPAYRPVATFGAGFDAVKQAIRDRAGRAAGGTETFAALGSVLKQMVGEPAAAERVILCFTDGQAGDSALAPQVRDDARRAGVKIWFVALGGGNFVENQKIAEATGGGLIAARDATQLARAFTQVANKTVRRDDSLYKLTIRASRKGGAFAAGEVLTPSVVPRSQRAVPRRYSVRIYKGMMGRGGKQSW